ncbi:MAG: zinc ribbon domain-containing protein [Clostridia bacterium]|nr:zinc ribbon domain-containing protein [Clostridia bacterium]
MAFCRNCGAEIHDDAVVCVNCGVAVEKPKTAKADDKKSGGFAFLCFLFPVLGLVLYLVWKEDYPLKAKSCAKGGIIGFVSGIVFSVLWGVLIGILGASGMAMLDDPEMFEMYEEGYEYLMLHLR